MGRNASAPATATGQRIAGDQARVAWQPAKRLGVPYSSLGTFVDQRAFEFDHHTEDLEGELALQAAGVDGITHRERISLTILLPG